MKKLIFKKHFTGPVEKKKNTGDRSLEAFGFLLEIRIQASSTTKQKPASTLKLSMKFSIRDKR